MDKIQLGKEEGLILKGKQQMPGSRKIDGVLRGTK